MERASSLLRSDPRKISDFRVKVSSYRTSAITATDLIDSFFSLFDTSSSELGKLIKELADIYEDESTRTSLLKAWNDWRAINEDYPALPGPNGLFPGISPSTVSGASGGGKRVLRLKSSTAQSSRSAVGRSGSLANALNPYSSVNLSSSPLPHLSSTAGSKRGAKTSPTAWGTSTPPSGPSPASNRPPSRPPNESRTVGVSGSATSEAFPALPATVKPNTLMAGLTRGTVRWDDRHGRNANVAANAWGAGNNASSTVDSVESADTTGGGGGGKKGKKKKGKGQTLFHFG
jgi:hypothetical protein